ncbi:molybdopterin molybdotransferase MoeA [Parasphingorhabdus sp.]|uniref:molybdopterin molybdotransferase MoeA n=1 Tax=Parasphingorhabdus sp. TaxID=2709688 RepID=UPI003A9369C3
MISFDEAQEIAAQAASELGTETVELENASGRVLAEAISAQIDAPRQDVSAMDGYAVTDASTALGDRLNVIGEAFAGARYSGAVGPDETIRIFTGAAMPNGTDRVIIQENVERDGRLAHIAREYGPGWNVRKQASDFATGDELLGAGSMLTPRSLLTVAAADRDEVLVALQPKITIIGTGDEIVAPGKAASQLESIPDSVTIGLAAYAKSIGGNVIARKRLADNLHELTEAAGEALAHADIVLVTGGASVGERDYAKTMFEPHGLELLFSKVAIKPGKPVWLGKAGDKFILGLPGNPASAMVTARLFLAPLLAKLQGQTRPLPLQWRKIPLSTEIGPNGPRETFYRAFWGENGLVILDNQSSGAQQPLAQTDWLVRRPANCKGKKQGSLVNALQF